MAYAILCDQGSEDVVFSQCPWLTCKSKCLRINADGYEYWCVYVQSRAQLGDVKTTTKRFSRTKKLRFLLTPVALDNAPTTFVFAEPRTRPSVVTTGDASSQGIPGSLQLSKSTVAVLGFDLSWSQSSSWARDGIVTYEDGDMNTGVARWTAKFSAVDKDISKHAVVFEHCALFRVPEDKPLQSVRFEVLRKDAEPFGRTVRCADGIVPLRSSPDWGRQESGPKKEVVVGVFVGPVKAGKTEFARLILRSQAVDGHLRSHPVKNTIGVKENCFDGILSNDRRLTLLDTQGMFNPTTGAPQNQRWLELFIDGFPRQHMNKDLSELDPATLEAEPALQPSHFVILVNAVSALEATPSPWWILGPTVTLSQPILQWVGGVAVLLRAKIGEELKVVLTHGDWFDGKAHPVQTTTDKTKTTSVVLDSTHFDMVHGAIQEHAMKPTVISKSCDFATDACNQHLCAHDFTEASKQLVGELVGYWDHWVSPSSG